MTKLEQLQENLRQTETNLQEFTDLRTEQNGKVLQLKADFVNDKSLLDELQKEQGRLATLDDSIHELTDTRAKLQKDVETERTAQSERESLLIAKEKAVEAAEAGTEYIETYSKLVEAINCLSEDLYTSLLKFRNRQQDYKESSQSFPNDRVKTLGVTDEQMRLATDTTLDLPSNWAQTIQGILRIKMQQKEWEAREKQRVSG